MLNPFYSHICMLVLERGQNKLSILVIEIDPFQPQDSSATNYNAFMLATNNPELPPSLQLESLKRSELLLT